MKTPTKRLTKKQKDEIFAAKLPGLLQYHQLMLNDPVRNKLLLEAITKNVSNSTHFLDIGAGTGVWAILAAKLGAKRVVAVEIEEPLIPIIYRHAKENGVAHKVEIIHGNSDDVKIRGKFDVIVSELFGGDALGEATVKSFVSIRERFLKPGGVLIPQKLTMLAAPVNYAKSINSIPAELSISCEFLKSLKTNYSQTVPIGDRTAMSYLAPPHKLVEMDFTNVEKAPSLEGLKASWKMENLNEANAIAVFNNSTFTSEIVMDSFNSQSWGASIYEFKPFEAAAGELHFNITMDGAKTIWSIGNSALGVMTTYSPSFTAARVKMATQMAVFKKTKSPKQTK